MPLKAPTFAKLECRGGELHPPGFFGGNMFWSDYDQENGFQVYCMEPDPIPDPGNLLFKMNI